MKYKAITIENLKGIKSVKIDFTDNRILTLVGLNESGKTTILEGIYLFFKLKNGEKLKPSDYNDIRPKGIGFSDSIKIKAELEFENDDFKKIQSFAKKEGHTSKLKFPTTFEYTYSFNYELHKYVETKTYALFEAKSSTAKFKLYKSNIDLWNKLVHFIKINLIPDILYYEDFVFEIPNEIPFSFGGYETIEEEGYSEWKLVLDDILKSIQPKFISFQENVVEIWQSDNDLARQIINAMEQKLDNVITFAWQELFKSTEFNKGNKRLNFKEIKIICNPIESGLNISFKVKSESGKEFSINERSKGFKWFFSFLIFTEFRKNRTKNILFLLDEPASNLHTSAQTKILDAIHQLSDKSMIVYSTHSQHLINPEWLKGAYVVENEAISAENLEGALTDTEAKINVSKYFNFVNKTNDDSKSIFFQPILDRLEYQPSKLELKPHITICEGKFDWYTFQYFRNVIFKDKFDFNFYPGTGKDDLGNIIRLYLSWGCEFTVVIDGDISSQKAKEQYIKNLPGILENKIHTYKDILGLECATEELFTILDKKNICDDVFGKGTYESVKTNKNLFKSKFNHAIIHLLNDRKPIELEEKTNSNFSKIFDFIKKINQSNK